jgi:hypothetical protein
MGFSVHIDPDELARQELAAGLPSAEGPLGVRSGDRASVHRGTPDSRQAARQRSERDHAGRAAGASGGRSYAFRRS